jgi:hypothetical protein
MKRQLKAPPKLTKEEAEKLKRCIWMADWHFEHTIKRKCTEVATYYIRWKKENWELATVFGLEAMKSETKEPCIANLFIRYENRVYQTQSLSDVSTLIELLKKDCKYDEYENKVREQKYREREKLISQKRKEKTKVRKLKIVTKKKAA